jgi:hypothetical protein
LPLAKVGTTLAPMDSSPLAGWDNYYVIIGSSAGGLTGLTFVVIALIRESMQGVRPAGVGAYVTPTIVHFGGVLALAAFLSMPHQHRATVSAGLAIAGLAGLAYGGGIAANMRNHGEQYVPVREDWIFNVTLPTLVYGALLVAALLIWRYAEIALFVVASATLGLLLIGIRNAWDIAVWMSIQKASGSDTAPKSD